MIGVRMRTEQYVRQATLDTMLNFVNGIGDANPLFRDQEYAAYSKYGSVVGHPCAPYMRHWSGRTRWGLPGVHGFFAGNDWEFFRMLRPGDAVNCVERVLGRPGKTERVLRATGHPVRRNDVFQPAGRGGRPRRRLVHAPPAPSLA